jgi:hypothetical protein
MRRVPATPSLLVFASLCVGSVALAEIPDEVDGELDQLLRRSRVQTVLLVVQADGTLRGVPREDLLRDWSRALCSHLSSRGIACEPFEVPLVTPHYAAFEERSPPPPPASRNPRRPLDVAKMRALLRDRSRDAVVVALLGQRTGRDGVAKTVLRLRVIDPFSQWTSSNIALDSDPGSGVQSEGTVATLVDDKP